MEYIQGIYPGTVAATDDVVDHMGPEVVDNQGMMKYYPVRYATECGHGIVVATYRAYEEPELRAKYATKYCSDCNATRKPASIRTRRCHICGGVASMTSSTGPVCPECYDRASV